MITRITLALVTMVALITFVPSAPANADPTPVDCETRVAQLEKSLRDEQSYSAWLKDYAAKGWAESQTLQEALKIRNVEWQNAVVLTQQQAVALRQKDQVIHEQHVKIQAQADTIRRLREKLANRKQAR